MAKKLTHQRSTCIPFRIGLLATHSITSADFMGPLPLSNGNQHILRIADHSTNWYEAIPLPDETATTTANALLKHWIYRFGCPCSINRDQGRDFELRFSSC